MNRTINILLLLLLGALTGCTDSAWNHEPIDDNEPTRTVVDICSPDAWSLASVPADPALFPESSLSNDVAYGKNRALLAWYTVDRVFTKSGSPLFTDQVNLDALSYPYAREVAISEVYPGHPLNYNESSVMPTLILSFYPNERGPYNLDGTNVDQDGHLLYPEKRWGGIMRKIDNTNLEQSNIEYIQFWLLDPFMDPELNNQDGGYLYITLGDVSEDILKDDFMSYENGLPPDGSTAYVTNTVWGKVSTLHAATYAFDNGKGLRLLQDVGLDGLTNQEELAHPTYVNYLNELCEVLPSSTIVDMLANPFSPFNDPAGDNYVYYLNYGYDIHSLKINDLYKYYNGLEGNSLTQDDAGDVQYEMARSTPDVEDINQDYMLNKDERFFQYRIAIHPDSLQVGMNYITDMERAQVHLRNGGLQYATWYQFTIPLHDYQKKIGSIQNFSNIRFIRMFMTGFKGTTHLRFATLELAEGE